MLSVLSMYRKHAPNDLGGNGDVGDLLWRDPEEFLDVLESAIVETSPARGLLKILNNAPPATLADIGRRALSIECSTFLSAADLKTERWLPYVLWASRLKKNDTVITFNYDRIPELLEMNSDRTFGPSRLSVIFPAKEDWAIDEKISSARAASSAPVFKLHGSVNWVAKDGNIDIDQSFDVAATWPHDLVLAIPRSQQDGSS
jgi:hypothetical protein